MAITKQKKNEILEKVKKVLAEAKSVTFVNFHGLKVSDTTRLRKTLRDAGAGYLVAKKTLTKKALSELGNEGEIPELPGELAIAYGEETVPARTVYEFGKKFEGALSILGGIFEGRFLGKDEMVEIAQIPPVPVLRGMFVNIINSPIQRFVIAMGQIAEKKQ